MSESNIVDINSENIISTKSWTAYISPIFSFLLLGTLFIGLDNEFNKHQEFDLYLYGILFILFVASVYKILIVRSYKLIMNEDGVWVFSGVLPWSKGYSGVKWRDLDEGVFYPNIIAYFFQSYKLQIKNRMKDTIEISLTQMNKGNKAIEKINNEHSKRIIDGQ